MKYNPALDGLRAIAIVSVVLYHCKIPVAQGGFYGVDLFFVLSGFLITGLLSAEIAGTGKIDIGRFYWNRLIRLTPPLYCMLAVLYLSGIERDWKLGAAALYLSDFTAEPGYGPLIHTWSLAVEEQFYLVWPLALMAILRARDPARVILWLIAAAMAWRCIALVTAPGNLVYFRGDTRLTGLLAGAYLAVARPTIETKTIQRLGWIALVVLGIAATTTQVYSERSLTLIQPLVELSAAILILSAMDAKTIHRRWLSHPVLVRVGVLSYSIYLWHYPIAWMAREVFDPFTTFVIVAAGSLAMAEISYRAIELPMRSFRARATVLSSTG
jgi:peptidoglycan/LPS O-acetylase OafA/YrhL